MKAVIVEIKDKYAAALYDDGTVGRIKNTNYQIGQEVNLKSENGNFSRRLVAIAASVIAIVSVTGVTAYAYNDPYSYVSLDVNPSIAFTVNRFDKVLHVDAVDSDAKAVLDKLDLKNKDIDDAVSETIDEINKEGYFPQNEQGGVVIAAYSDDQNKSDELQSSLQVDTQDQLKNNGVSADVEVMGVGRERVLEAQSMGVTPGKLNLVQKLQASAADPSTINVQDWLTKPVKDIMKQIKANGKDAKKSGDETSQPSATPAVSPSETPSTSPSATQTPDASKNKHKGSYKNGKTNSGGNAAQAPGQASQKRNENAQKDKTTQNDNEKSDGDHSDNSTGYGGDNEGDNQD